MHENLLGAVVAAYIGATLLLFFSVFSSKQDLRGTAILVTLAGVVLHSTVQYRLWFAPGTVEINSLDVLSLCALAVVAILLISPLWNVVGS